ncbi:MAG: hypothetical protein JSS29_02970 [Proteobacteria bacterium]|nr:hypothetical protein [Pseudomonadota bacterium]
MIRTCLWFAFLAATLPVAPADAAVLDSPDVGVRLAGLPDSLAAPIVTQRPHGWGAVAQDAITVVDLYRQEHAAPGPASFSDPQYQKQVLAEFEGHGAPQGQLRTAQVDGRDALIVFGAGRLASHPAIAQFYCHVYVLADQHLTRMSVDAFRLSNGTIERPPEFDQLVRVLLDAKLQPVVHASADSAGPQQASRVVFPHLVMASIPYPEHELKVGGAGTVGVEFSLNAKAQVTDFKQTSTDRGGLGEEIPRFLRTALFWPTADWDPTQKVTMDFRYTWLDSEAESCPVKAPNRSVNASVDICCAHGKHETSQIVRTQFYSCQERLDY